jgi:predicted CoA-binding protein
MTIPEILDTHRTIAVVGLSSNRSKPSYSVTAYMKSQGYRIIPVNPNETEVLGERAYARLQDVPEPVEIVNVFRRSEHVRDVVDDAIGIGAKVIWLQEGVVDETAARRARAAGLDVVMDLCILKEHMRK